MSSQADAEACAYCAIVQLTHPDWHQPSVSTRCAFCGRQFCHVHGDGEPDATTCVLHRQLPVVSKSPLIIEGASPPTKPQRLPTSAQTSEVWSTCLPRLATQNEKAAAQQQAKTMALTVPEVRLEPSAALSEPRRRPIEYRSQGGCCLHSTAQADCRRSTCCPHGDPNLCTLRPGTPRSTRRHFDFVPQAPDPSIPRIVCTYHSNDNESTIPEATIRPNLFMLNAERAPFFIPQLGRVTAFEGQQHLYVRGMAPIPVLSEILPNGMLVHLSEDLYLLLQPEQAVICVEVPEDGGTFIMSSNRRIYLHPTHGVIRLGRKQFEGEHVIQQVNIETHHDSSVVRQMIADVAEVEIKATRIFDSPKAEWTPPSIASVNGSLLMNTTTKLTPIPSKDKVRAVNHRVPVRGWVQRPVSHKRCLFIPTLAGLWEWATTELQVPRPFATPRVRYAEEKSRKVFAIDELLGPPVCTLPLFAPYLGQTMELHMLRQALMHKPTRSLTHFGDQSPRTPSVGSASLTSEGTLIEESTIVSVGVSNISRTPAAAVYAISANVGSDQATKEARLKDSSTIETPDSEDDVSSFSSSEPDLRKNPKLKSRFEQKVAQAYEKTKDVVKVGRTIWRYMM